MAGCASTLPEADPGILDVSPPPINLYPARLVRIDGHNVSSSDARPCFWVDPGVHEITVAAFVGGPLSVGRDQPATTRAEPGVVTIEVEAGRRYRIASRLTGKRGDLEPVVWRVDDIR